MSGQIDPLDDYFRYLSTINQIMRQQLYKFQTRQQKIQREESATRQPQLSKVSSYTPGHWKSYIPHQISHSSEKRSQRTPSYYNHRTGEPNYQANGEEDSRIRSILSSRKQQQKKRQQSALRKVRELQQKVLPMVKGNRDQQQGVWIGWQSRIQQKLLRLEGQVENMKRQMELQLERRILDLENKWDGKFADLTKSLEQRQ